MGVVEQVDTRRAGGDLARGRLVIIEALRGVAALAVVALHSLGASATLGVSPGPAGIALEAGVDVFFVISGFVMVHASRRDFGLPGAAWRFASHRIARVVPLYWGVTTAFALAAWWRPAAFTDALDGWPSLLASYVFLPWERADGSMLPVFRLGWTLQFEALFYTLFAMFVGLRRGPALTAIGASLAGLIALGLLWPAAPVAVRFWTDPIIAEFGFGMALAVAYDRGHRLPFWTAPALILAALGLLLAAPEAMGLPRPLAFGVPAVLLVALALLPERPVLDRRARGLVMWLGSVSYALYLTHLFAVRAVREAFSRFGADAALFVPTAVVASLVLAAIVHRWLERPAVAAVRGWLC